MEAYYNTVRALEDKFYGIELNHVPRRYNEEADELAKIASRRITIPPERFCAGRRATVHQPRTNTLESGGTLGGSLESSRHGAHG
jgi:hypothetical protein